MMSTQQISFRLGGRWMLRVEGWKWSINGWVKGEKKSVEVAILGG